MRGSVIITCSLDGSFVFGTSIYQDIGRWSEAEKCLVNNSSRCVHFSIDKDFYEYRNN